MREEVCIFIVKFKGEWREFQIIRFLEERPVGLM